MSQPRVRPRVEGDREGEILEATARLLLEVGYDRLTMDAVAREAKASKATLYRRWDSKPDLVLAALVHSKGHVGVTPADTGSLRGDLVSTFCGGSGIARSGTSAVMGAVVTAITTDPEFGELFREQFVRPKIEATRVIYDRAIARGEISADLDLDVITPALAGVLLHRMFLLGVPASDDQVERVIDHLILPAVTAAPASNPRKKKS